MKKRLVPQVVCQLCMGSIPAALVTLYILHSIGPASAECRSS